MEKEICTECEAETGRAGELDDSLYAGDFGPYCEDCWADVPDNLAEMVVTLQRKVQRLENQIASSTQQ